MLYISILVSITVLLLLCMGNKFLRDARGIRKELAHGKTLRELDDMVHDSREELLATFDEISEELDRRTARLENLTREAETLVARLEALLKDERLKSLEERGILFAIDVDKEKGERDRSKRIADLLRSGASVEEVARMTEASVREVELIKLLIRRKEEERA